MKVLDATDSARGGRRFKARPLTEDQRAMVEAQAGWVEPWVRTVVYPHVLRQVGLDECVSMAWELVVVAASLWRPDRGTTFTGYAMTGVKRSLPTRLLRQYRKRGVWSEMPARRDDGRPMSAELPDGRPAERDPLLVAWCDPDARHRRRVVGWRERLVLYLRFVECRTLDDVGRLLGVTRQRVIEIEKRGLERLAEQTRDIQPEARP